MVQNIKLIELSTESYKLLLKIIELEDMMKSKFISDTNMLRQSILIDWGEDS